MKKRIVHARTKLSSIDQSELETCQEGPHKLLFGLEYRVIALLIYDLRERGLEGKHKIVHTFQKDNEGTTNLSVGSSWLSRVQSLYRRDAVPGGRRTGITIPRAQFLSMFGS